MPCSIKVALLSLGIAMCTAPMAQAWGPEGHAIIADIAESHLSPVAATEVKRLLATEGHSKLDEVSSWADDYRGTHLETGPWHFVDIPLRTPSYSEARDCHYDQNDNMVPEQTCIVAKLPEYVATLADKTKSDDDRLVALKFVVHFAGDSHQPLHAENNSDRGGNNIHLTYFKHTTNLHAVWDGGVIEHHYGWKLGPNYSFDHTAVAGAAADLDSSISSADRLSWAPTRLLISINDRAVDWANEAHTLAPAAYDNLPDKRTGQWATAYQAYAWPVIENRLQRAGVRLSGILNEALN